MEWHYSTMHLNISKSEESLFSQFDEEARRSIKKAIKTGVEVQESIDEEDIKSFYDLYIDMALKENFRPISLKEFSNKGAILIAKLGDEVIGGAVLGLRDEGKRMSILINTTNEEHKKLQVNYMIYWTSFVYAKSRGCKIFDFAGFDKNAEKDSKIHTINQFKKQFNGEVVEMHENISLATWIKRKTLSLDIVKKIWKSLLSSNLKKKHKSRTNKK